MTQNKTTTELEQEIQNLKNTFAETLQKQKEEYKEASEEQKDIQCRQNEISLSNARRVLFLIEKSNLIIRFYELLLQSNFVNNTIRGWDEPGLLFNEWYIEDKSILDNFYIRMSKALAIKNEIKGVVESCNRLCEENDDSFRLNTNFAL